MSPERRRRTVDQVRRRLGLSRISERRACRVLGQSPTTQRYRPRQPADEAKLLAEMRFIARQRPRFGCERIHQQLIERGWHVNVKRVHRLWKREAMQVPSTTVAFRSNHRISCEAKICASVIFLELECA